MTGKPTAHVPGALVISSGRCGSTLLSTMLRLHGDVLSLSELFSCIGADTLERPTMTGDELWEAMSVPHVGPSLLVRHRLEPDEYLYPLDGSGRFTRGDAIPPVSLTTLPHLSDEPDGLLDEVEALLRARPEGRTADHLHALFDHLALRFGRSVWVERSGGSSGHAAQLLALFPDAPVVHLYRDGGVSALSMSRHTGFRLTLIGTELASVTRIDPYSLRLGQVPPCPDPRFRAVWPDAFTAEAILAHPIPLERFGTMWSTLVGRGAQALRGVEPQRLLHVRYEDLVDDPSTEARRLARFLGIDPHGSWVDAATRAVRVPAGDRRAPDELIRACRIGERYLRDLTSPATG